MVVNIDGVGAFELRQRTVRNAIAITAEYNRLTEGASAVTPEFAAICDMLAFLQVSVAHAPDGWAPYEADPDDTEAMARIQRVYEELRAAQVRFRAGAGEQPEGPSAGAEPVD